MTPEAILAVSAAVLTCTQLCKWAFLPDKYGPVAVLLISLAGLLFWVWSQGAFLRAEAFSYFSAWLTIALSAAGVYGFSRAGSEAVTRLMPPPASGAGSEPTVKG